MANLTDKPSQNSGIPLGGIGTGTVELRPDGEFHEWQIANAERWAKVCGNTPNIDNGENLAGALSFFLRTEGVGGDEPVRLRRLGFGLGHGQDCEEYNYRMFSWLKPVEEIKFNGNFPLAELEYIDGDLPVDIKLEALSPFVPHDSQISGTPGFYLRFRIHNRCAQKIRVALAGKLKNILCRQNPDGKRFNEVQHKEDVTFLNMKTTQSTDEADNGSVCLSVRGGESSWLAGDYAAYMNEYVASGEFGVSEESFLFRLRREGCLPNTINQIEYTDSILDDEGLEALSDEKIDTHLSKLLESAYAQSLINRIKTVRADILDTRSGKISCLKYLRNIRETLQGRLREHHGSWGDGALCSSFIIEPDEEKNIDFVLAWFFPNHYGDKDNLLGHMYENLFDSAKDANRFLVEKIDEIPHKVRQFANNLRNSSFDPIYAEAWGNQLTTLIKGSWWLKNEDFGIWEGLGSCGFHTTDITYHGSFGLVSLFPDLQKKQMRMGARFQREDGRVHHFFTPDLSAVDDGFDRVDMNPQFVLLVCRDYLWTGDQQYLKDMWPHIIRAMDSIALLDSNNDGLPDTDTKRNTYDAWNFFGTSSYVSCLWLAALKAAIMMGQALDETVFVNSWAETLEKGTASFDSKLWNDSYYLLWDDGERRDDCCMTNQLDGEWFVRMLGMSGILPENKTKSSVQFIFRNNYTEESGLINASYPDSTTPTLYTFQNCQAEANWSGVEYIMASFSIMLGMEDIARRIVKNVDKRYRRLGQVWNHSECGDHYYRGLSSWTLMQALTGFLYDSSNSELSISKVCAEDQYHGPWVTTTGWGQIRAEHDKITCLCESGSLLLTNIELPFSADNITLLLNENGMCFSIKGNNTVAFERIDMKAGDQFTVSKEK